VTSPAKLAKTKPWIALITSAFQDRKADSFDYFALLTSEVVKEFQADLDVVVFVPFGSDVGKDQADLVKKLGDRQEDHYLNGLIVSPFEVSTRLSELAASFSKKHNCRVLAVDQALPLRADANGNKPMSVVPDNFVGGKYAANALHAHFSALQKKATIKKPRFLVVMGSGASPDRLAGFKDQILELVPGSRVVTDGPFIFGREEGRDWAMKYKFWKQKDLVGVFACNDELALGVRDALEEMAMGDPDIAMTQFAIVGFDGIRDAMVEIGRPNERWLINSVRVPIDQLAKGLKSAYLTAGAQRGKSNGTIRIKPEPAKTRNEQMQAARLLTNRRTLARVSCKFAVLTFKHEEFAAAQATLTDAREHPRRQHWVYGTVAGHRVGVVQTTDQGPVAAQGMALQVLDELEPEWVVVLGIAGAMPDSDLSIGDVALGRQFVQLALPKHDKGPPKYVDFSQPLNGREVAAVEHLHARVQGWIKPLSVKARSNRFEVTDSKWQDLIRDNLQKRNRREPTAHLATIMCDGGLWRDLALAAQNRDSMWTRRKWEAVEMELDGVVRAVREKPGANILVIRAISDLIGYRRDNSWTNYACDSAAMFFKSALRHMD
jgi:nucleoside phosphorylase/DNA-binding LacI/PurR family transcriptional regulator